MKEVIKCSTGRVVHLDPNCRSVKSSHVKTNEHCSVCKHCEDWFQNKIEEQRLEAKEELYNELKYEKRLKGY